MAASLVRSKRGYARWVIGGLVTSGGVVGAISYARADTAERRRTRVGAQGVVRFLRSISVGLLISLDYWWAGRGLDEVRANDELMWRCGAHQLQRSPLVS